MKRLQLIILGAIASFAFPPYNLWFLIVLFLFPIRFAFNTSSSIKAFQAGFLFALGLFFSGIFWIYISLNSYSNVNIFISLGSVLLLSAYLSLFYGVANASLTFIRNRAHPLYLALGVAIVFSFAELIKGSILGGFNWFTVYHSQLYGPFRGLFPLFGGSGVSFLILYTIGLFAVFPEINEKKRKKILVQMIMGFIVSFLFFEFHWTTSSPTGYQFSLVQGGFTQDQRLNPRFQQLMQNFYFTEVSDEISESDIVILPEGSFTNSNAIRSLTPIDGKMIITGALEVNSNGNAFNSIFAIGDEIQSYQKRFLVPFGEFIPREQIFESSLKALRLPIPRITPGEILQQPLIFKDILIGPSICFEDSFSKTYANFISSNIFINLTNDAWFDDSIGLDQHLAFSQIRSLEYGKPMLRVANTGITAHIDSNGMILSRLAINEQNVLRGPLIVAQGNTPYGIFGELLLVFCLLIVVIVQSVITKLRIF